MFFFIVLGKTLKQSFHIETRQGNRWWSFHWSVCTDGKSRKKQKSGKKFPILSFAQYG
jgi:hypothetical protein